MTLRKAMMLVAPLTMWSSSILAQTVAERQVPFLSQLPPNQQAPHLAYLMQDGVRDTIVLEQSGAGNLAHLVQQGDRNAMTVRQSGGDNRLSWRQVGSDLPDLRVVQSGAMTLSIVQTAPSR